MLVKHGIVTDLASCLDASKLQPIPGAAPWSSGPQTYRLFAPKEGRYRITAAQVAFVRVMAWDQ